MGSSVRFVYNRGIIIHYVLVGMHLDSKNLTFEVNPLFQCWDRFKIKLFNNTNQQPVGEKTTKFKTIRA